MIRLLAIALSTCCASALAEAPAQSEADPDTGREIYLACSTCHRADGSGSRPLDTPAIAGRAAWTTAAQLNAFASGWRGDHTEDVYGRRMALFAKALSADNAIRDVSEYIETLPPHPGERIVIGDTDRGKTKYATCVACHGVEGRGQRALNAPALAGLDDWYVLRQLENFRAGIRGYAPGDTNGQQMRSAAQVLTEDRDVHDVVAYIATLDAP